MAYESRYPWDRWTNGQAWMVRQGADFTSYGKSFSGTLYAHASAIGMAVTTSVFEYEYGDDIVIFQFYDPDDLMKPNLKALPAWRDQHRKRSSTNA